MADLSVVRGAVGAWLSTLIAALVSLLTAAVLPRWVKVVSVDDVQHTSLEADVGLWQTCRYYGPVYNCTPLHSHLTADWFHDVQILSVCACVTTVCCAFVLCLLVVRSDCWRIRPHTVIHVLLSALLLAAGLLQLVAVILCGVKVPHSLPICIDFCPASAQPLPSCLAAAILLPPCRATTTSTYVIASVGAGLAVTSGLVGVAMSRDSNGDDDELLLNGVADVVATQQPADDHVTE